MNNLFSKFDFTEEEIRKFLESLSKERLIEIILSEKQLKNQDLIKENNPWTTIPGPTIPDTPSYIPYKPFEIWCTTSPFENTKNI